MYIYTYKFQRWVTRLQNLTLAVREASVSRHNGDQLRAPLKLLNTV